MGLSVLIADDHELFREGVRSLVTDVLDASDVRQAASLDEALEKLNEGPAPDLLIVDLRMPGVSGVESLSALRDALPGSKVVVMSASEERSDILSALAAGINGYIPKSLSAAQIEEALRDVLSGRLYAPATLGRREDGAEPQPERRFSPITIEGLTSRQKDVLAQLLKGQSSKEIARALGIAEGTVKIHLAAIYRAAGVRTRAEAIAKLSALR
ncbi:MAG TPA: response regulator transcription factor [Caulobacterales bacterium]|jgi:DNA-binding NarL/FixJ family response regulator|nr:response regulator transcription factor [Caulobacterales bacterium]